MPAHWCHPRVSLATMTAAPDEFYLVELRGLEPLTPACKIAQTVRYRRSPGTAAVGTSAEIGSCRMLLWSGLVVSWGRHPRGLARPVWAYRPMRPCTPFTASEQMPVMGPPFSIRVSRVLRAPATSTVLKAPSA
jgi:hypothetical protein